MYLQSGNLCKSERGTNTISQKSSEESVTNAIPILKLTIEEDSFLDSSSSMASKTHIFASILDAQPMIFNVRLVFTRTNIHNGQLFKDPMNYWVINIKEHPIAFDPFPWVNYQEIGRAHV